MNLPKLPRARRDDLLTTNLDDEVVVYDPERKQAHSLNRVAVAVWHHSDGTQTIEDLQRLASDEIGTPVPEEAVWLALRKLERAHLLLDKVGSGGALTRREMLGKSARYGAMAMATPLIASALVPVAAAAASPVFTCNNGGLCGSITACATDPSGRTCFCFIKTEGGSFCGGNYFCAGAQACTTTSQCPTGKVCLDTCCGKTCGPACGEGELSITVGGGLTAAG